MSKPVKVIGACIVALLYVWIILTSAPSGETALVGAYTASFAKDEYFLELREDGTYTQRIVRADGSELTNTGHWKSGDSRIEVSNFQWFDEMGEFETVGLWNGYVGTTLLGRPRLEFYQDLGFFFSYSSPLPEKKDPNE